MTESGDKSPEPTQSTRPANAQRRGRRGGRGRGRGGQRRSQTASKIADASAHIESDAPEAETAAKATAPTEALPLVERVARLASRVATEPRYQVAAVTQAIDEVTAVIEKLKSAVEQMEEVLELVELAERQKLADEREIDILRRHLRQLHRPQERRAPERERYSQPRMPREEPTARESVDEHQDNGPEQEPH